MGFSVLYNKDVFEAQQNFKLQSSLNLVFLGNMRVPVYSVG